MNEILSRIAKLLAKANDSSCTEAEAATFLAKATQLLTEHNLDLQDIALTNDNTSDSFLEEEVFSTGRWIFPHQSAYSVINQFCFVKGVFYYKRGKQRNVKQLYLFGTKSNIETARWMFDALLAAYERLFDQYRARTLCDVKCKNIYISGVTEGFVSKMHAERESSSANRDIDKKLTNGGTALAIRSVEDNMLAAFNEVYSKNKTTNIQYSRGTGGQSIRQDGYTAGQKLTLNRAISATAQRKLS